MTFLTYDVLESEIAFWRREMKRRAELLDERLEPASLARFDAKALELRAMLATGQHEEAANEMPELARLVCETFCQDRVALPSLARAKTRSIQALAA